MEPTKYFKLKINLGNDAMQTAEDVGNALRRLAEDIERGWWDADKAWLIADSNGNNVGTAEVK